MRHGRKALLAGAACFFAAGVQARDLTDTVRKAIGYNPDVLVTQSDRLALDQEIRAAQGGYLPRVDLYGGIGKAWNNNPSTRAATGTDDFRDLRRVEEGVRITQMLFDGFFTKNEVLRQRARAQAASYRVLAAAEDVGLRAAQVYIDVLRRQEIVQLAETNLLAHRGTFDQIGKRSERGVGRVADTDQARGRYALAEANLAAEQGNLRNAQIAFLRVVGEMPADLPVPEAPADKLPADMQADLASAIEHHPIIKSAVADIDATLAQHEQARANDFPRLDLELGARHFNNINGVKGDDEELIAMVRANYNIYRGGTDLANKRATAHRITEAKTIRDRAEDQVIEEASLAWNEYTTIAQRIGYLREHAEAATKTREAYGKQFNIGQRTLLDLLDTENERFVANSNYVDGKYRLLFSHYRVLQSQGLLLPSLGVTPPEESVATAP